MQHEFNENLDMGLDDEEILCENTEEDQQDIEFDNMVYELQELLISEEFEEVQNEFIREKCKYFNGGQEDKQEHTQIFNDYQASVESFIEQRLTGNIKNFSLKEFGKLLSTRQNRIDEQILETLLSFSDFQLFKEIMSEQKVRVEEEERTIKKKTNKANNKVKQTSANIFSINQQVTFPDLNKGVQGVQVKQQQKKQEEEEIEEGDLRPDLFLCVRALPTPKLTKQKKA